jgi:hypothetical protein
MLGGAHQSIVVLTHALLMVASGSSVVFTCKKASKQVNAKHNSMARPEGFEPPTLCFEGRCSIQLSYGRAAY